MYLVTTGVGVSMNVAAAVGDSTMVSVVVSAVVALETGVSATDELGVVALAVVLSLEAGSVDEPWALHALSARRRIGAASQDFFIVIAIASFRGLVGVWWQRSDGCQRGISAYAWRRSCRSCRPSASCQSLQPCRCRPMISVNGAEGGP